MKSSWRPVNKSIKQEQQPRHTGRNNGYPVQLWGISFLATPLFLIAGMLLPYLPHMELHAGLLFYLVLLAGFGAVLFLASFFLHRWAFRQCTRFSFPPLLIKLLLSLVALACITGTFFFLARESFRFTNSEDQALMGACGISSLLAGWSCPVYRMTG